MGLPCRLHLESHPQSRSCCNETKGHVPDREPRPRDPGPGSYRAALRCCRIGCWARGLFPWESMCCDSQGWCVCIRWVNAALSNMSGPLKMPINGVHVVRDISHHCHVRNVHSWENSSTPTIERGVLSLQIHIISHRKQIPSLTRKG